jgi:hypothetical protein
MSSKLIQKIAKAFNKKVLGNSGSIEPGYPYYNFEETPEIGSTQPWLKSSLLETVGRQENYEVTKIARLNSAKPQMHQRWFLKVVNGTDQGRQYLAASQEIKIGRKPENHICLNDPKVSRYHALLRFEESNLVIIDLNSTNGTNVNGARLVTEQKLCSGDMIRVGETIMQIIAEPW